MEQQQQQRNFLKLDQWCSIDAEGYNTLHLLLISWYEVTAIALFFDESRMFGRMVAFRHRSFFVGKFSLRYQYALFPKIHRFPLLTPSASSFSHVVEEEDRSQKRKVLLDAVNRVDQKQKHFWTLEQLQAHTDRLLEYCAAARDSRPSDLPYGRPSTAHFFQVMEAWMERSLQLANGIDSAERARSVLEAILPQRDIFQREYTIAGKVINPKAAFLKHIVQTSHYEVVLQAYAVAGGGVPAAERAESLVSQMIQACRVYMKQISYRKGQGYNNLRPPEPTIKTFNILLNCWAKSGAYEAADRVEALWELMDQWNQSCTKWALQHPKYTYAGCRPNERSLVCWIEAWTHGRPQEAPEVALRILREVMIATDNPQLDQYEKYRDVQLDVAVFNAVIYAWVRSHRGRAAAMTAEEILQMLLQWSQVSNNSLRNRPSIEPNTRTYSMIIMAWAECEAVEHQGDAAQRAETILMKMVQLYQAGSHNVKPNSLLFTSCIAAWSRAASHNLEAPGRAEQLWELLRSLYNETGSTDIEFEPTTHIGNAVISAWSRCIQRPDSVPRAIAALKLLQQEGKDDLISYNTVLDAMAKKGLAKDAMDLLQWLEQQSTTRRTDLQPDLVSYNSVLAAFGRATVEPLPAAEEAEALLRKMEWWPRLKPDKKSYNCTFYSIIFSEPVFLIRPRTSSPLPHFCFPAVMNAWSRSASPLKVQRATNLLRDMIRQYEQGDVTLKPDVFVYTTLIKTCAHFRKGTKTENAQALDVALNAISTLENTDYGPPNDVTYSMIMTAIYRLLDSVNDQDSLLESAFRRCATRGLVSTEVLHTFHRVASERLVRRLLTTAPPLEWSRSVPVHKKPHRRP